MLKTEDRLKAIDEYMDEIKKLYPEARVRVTKDRFSTEDAWVVVEGIRPRSVDRVQRSAIELQQKWYFERGVYIFVTVSGISPL